MPVSKLGDYRRKRDADKTPEPFEDVRPSPERPRASSSTSATLPRRVSVVVEDVLPPPALLVGEPDEEAEAAQPDLVKVFRLECNRIVEQLPRSSGMRFTGQESRDVGRPLFVSLVPANPELDIRDLVGAPVRDGHRETDRFLQHCGAEHRGGNRSVSQFSSARG